MSKVPNDRVASVENTLHEHEHVRDGPVDVTNESGSDRVGLVALDMAKLINTSTQTIVGLWDLEKPPSEEKIKVLRQHARLNESVGPVKDHRLRVDQRGVKPQAEYKAICKLFMGYRSNPNTEYVGTGWLISNDTVVTAGHFVYDKGSAGLLRYVKCYFDYAGPGSPGTYRYGSVVAAPCEYLKATGYVYDVGLIRLAEPMVNVPFLEYRDTPPVANATLGLVGYPPDLNNGDYMYECWAQVDIQLANSGMLLSYKIDTYGGQAGSPLLSKQQDDTMVAIGVHVQGGYPNIGSTFGPIGNAIGDYVLALKVKTGLSSPRAKIVAADPKITTGFSIIASESEELAVAVEPISPAASSAAILRATESAMRPILGSGSFGLHGDILTNRPVAQLTRYPDALVLTSNEADSGPRDYDKALAAAKARDDIQTIFFVNLHSGSFQGQAKEDQKHLMDLVQSWQAWMTTLCEDRVQQQVDAGKLPDDDSGKVARSSYRSKVFDASFRRASWFAKMFDQNLSKHIIVKTAEFHTEILSKILEGFAVPESVFTNIDSILTTISNGIKSSPKDAVEGCQYWIMMTKYNYIEITDTVQAVIRTISFRATEEAQKYATNKASYETVKFDLMFSQYQADFFPDIYGKVRNNIDQKLIDGGMDLVKNRSTDIPI